MTEKDVRARLSEYYTAEQIERWLSSPHPQLGGYSAQSLIDAGRSDEVHAILDRLDSDAYL